MAKEYQEAELLVKLRHHVNEAASDCQMMSSDNNRKARSALIIDAIKHLNEAAACTKGISQIRKDTRWHGFTVEFEAFCLNLKKIPFRRAVDGDVRGLWYALHLGLMTIREQVEKLADARALSYGDSMALLDQRETMAANTARQQRAQERASGKAPGIILQ